VFIIELKHLFSPSKIGNVEIKNRIVRSATHDSKATNDGYVTDKLVEFYDELAKGGVGLIISGYIAVDPIGAQTHRMPYLYDESYIPGQRRLVKAIHEYSDVKVAAQIAHTGNLVPDPNVDTVGPSPIRDPMTKKVCRVLKNEEIRQIITKFVEAGCRAYECEYDMVQLHAGHGYLLSDFISPFTNRRNDEFGGKILNRIKIIIDIFTQLKEKLDKKFPIIIKLTVQDFLGEGKGLALKEGVEIAKYLVDLGFDAIEPTSGRTNIRVTNNKLYPIVSFRNSEDENYFVPTAQKLKPIMKDCPLILQGGIRNPLSAENFLKENIADFISMSRPFIYEPNLPNRWKSGDISPAKWYGSTLDADNCIM